MINRWFDRTLHSISFFCVCVQSNFCNCITQCVFVTITRLLHRWIFLVERYKNQIIHINHLRFDLMMIVELCHRFESNLSVKISCMQSNFRSWITLCAFVTSFWFLHRWIALVRRYKYHVLYIQLILWMSCLWTLWMFVYEIFCFVYKSIERKLEF